MQNCELIAVPNLAPMISFIHTSIRLTVEETVGHFHWLCFRHPSMWHIVACLVAASLVLAEKTVHVVFSNHLDIGFDNIDPYLGYDSNVLNMYFNRYLPLAVDNADWMQRVSPHRDRYIYTTHAYLLSLFLDCPPGMGLLCPGPFTKDKVIRGIKSGAIAWHAHPHNAQYELYDPSLLEASIDLVHELDRRFGMKTKHTAILHDVPGLTRAVIPIFASKGIKAVSIGVNPGSAPPGVPQFTPFIWRDEATNTQLIAFWRPGGYGGIHGGVNLDPPEQCIQAAGLDHVLCTAWRNDNAGPPLTVLEPLRIYQLLRQEWAGSSSSSGGGGGGSESVTIKASSFDDFVDAVLEALPRLNLTVVTGEIGDTWVFGVQSDPLKTANFRAASRARAHCISRPGCPSEGEVFNNFSRLLVKVPEHTWGVDVKKTLHDWDNFSNPDFYSCLPNYWQQQQQQWEDTLQPKDHSSSSSSIDSNADDGVPLRKAPCANYEHCLHAWDRQAAYIDWALQALPPGHPVLQSYKLDVASRKQLAAVNPETLIAAGAVKHTANTHHHLQQQLREVHDETPPVQADSSSRGLLHMPQQSSTQQSIKLQRQQQQAGLGGSTSSAASNMHNHAAAAGSLGVRSYTCGTWKIELDEAQGAITSLQKLYTTQRTPGVDWAAGSSSSSGGGSSNSGSSSSSNLQGGGPASCASPQKNRFTGGLFGQIKYSAYCEASYDVIWKHYAWQLPLPWWFAQDFSGRVNSSRAWNKEVEMAAHLEEIYETFAPGSAAAAAGDCTAIAQLALRYSFPQELMEKVGAPATMWTVVSCPSMPSVPDSSSTASPGDLEIAVVWQAKAPTRLPEAIWLSFVPAAIAVDLATWKLHKLRSLISPSEVILNGSQSMHAVSDAGVSVLSADHSERLQIMSWDAALVSPGKPTPFPNGVFPPCMAEGMHFNLMNNIWGTNYVMWVPYSKDDVNLAFRFSVHAEQLPAANARSAGTA